jgi:type I restriction enzyme S subunit
MSNEKKLIPSIRFPDFKNEREWEEKLIEEIAISESSSMALNKLELKASGYAVYGADSIVGYIDEFQQSEKYISIVKDGSGVGRLNLCQSNSSILGTLACIKSKNKLKYHLDWIYYLLNTIDFSVYVKGAGIPHIYYTDFKKENVAVPKPNEQQKIASCLSSLDEVIAAHSQKLDLLKDHKKGLMQNLFPQEGEKVPKYRFMEFEKDGEWVEKKLGELAELTSSKRVHLADYVSSGVPFFRGKEISQLKRNQFPDDILYISNEQYKEIKDKHGVPKKGDILITAVGTLGNVYCIKNDDEFYFKDGNLIWMKNISIDSHFLDVLLDVEKEKVLASAIGSSQKALTMAALNKIEFQIPRNPKEQQKIATCLFSLDALINAQAEKIEQLKLHKKGLMQGLFPKIND